MPLLILMAAVFLAPLMYLVLTYNTLVALRNHIREAWSNIDTELKRRYELIPNLVATVKGYAAHEQAVLEKVVALRTQCMANSGPTAAQAALKRIINTGATVRCQSPIVSHVNDDPDVWARMWQMQVQMGAFPYYMFIARNTGAKEYFKVVFINFR